jgi:hypothetical protein
MPSTGSECPQLVLSNLHYSQVLPAVSKHPLFFKVFFADHECTLLTMGADLEHILLTLSSLGGIQKHCS